MQFSRALPCGSTNIYVGGTLRLSRGRSRKVYVLIAVNTVPSRSSRYICGFLRLSTVAEPRLEPQSVKDCISTCKSCCCCHKMNIFSCTNLIFLQLCKFRLELHILLGRPAHQRSLCSFDLQLSRPPVGRG